jgi:Family of unknown function (DUF6152)
MLRTLRPALLALAALLTLHAGVGLAHHSTGMFDQAKTTRLVGTVKEFQWTNPHSWIQLNVANADGVIEEWSIEGNSPNQLIRLGWRPGTLKPGDNVTVLVKPMRDGSKAGLFVEITLADGTVLKQYDR